MVRELVAMLLITLVVNSAGGGFALAQNGDTKTVQQTNEIKAKIAKIGTGEKSKVNLELHDKTKLKGVVSSIDIDSFTLTDQKTGSTTQIAYAQVAKVSRQGITLGSKIAIAGLAAGGTVLLLLWRAYYCNEQAC